jgi:hypothetical protein
MTKFKDCRCGASILADMAECSDCLVTGIQARGQRRGDFLRRNLLVKRHMSSKEAMDNILTSPESQAKQILAGKAAQKRAQANRAGQALMDWS